MYEQNKILISIDQKTGIQALERLFPDKLVKQGYIKKREHSYKRHGIKNLIAGFVVATGKILGKCYDRNRNIEFQRYSFSNLLYIKYMRENRASGLCPKSLTQL